MAKKILKDEKITISPKAEEDHFVITSVIETNDDIDCDLMAFLLNKDGIIKDRWNILFYNNLSHDSGGITHLGGNSISKSKNEEILISFSKLPADCEKIVFLLSIYDAAERNQNLSMINKANIVFINAEDKQELFSCDLSVDDADKRAITIGSLYRENEAWTFEFQDKGEEENMVVSLSEAYGMRRDWRYFRNR